MGIEGHMGSMIVMTLVLHHSVSNNANGGYC
jgi:hypothetical protein